MSGLLAARGSQAVQLASPQSQALARAAAELSQMGQASGKRSLRWQLARDFLKRVRQGQAGVFDLASDTSGWTRVREP